MCGHSGEQQDAEDRSSWAKSSTRHRFEKPPGIFPALQLAGKVFTLFNYSTAASKPMKIVVSA
jgi:hypothetical protein